MRRTFLISLSSAVFLITASTSGKWSAVAGQVRDAVQSEYFTARVVRLESDAPGSRWITIAYTAVPLSQAETVAIRFDDRHCVHPAFLTDADGNKFIPAECFAGAPASERSPFWLEYPSEPLIQRYHFVGTASGGRGPYDVVIPITYAKSDEEDRPPPVTAQVLSFTGIE